MEVPLQRNGVALQSNNLAMDSTNIAFQYTYEDMWRWSAPILVDSNILYGDIWQSAPRILPGFDDIWDLSAPVPSQTESQTH